MMTSAIGPRVIVALDFATEAEAMAMADRLDPGKGAVKVGKELFTAAGPGLVQALVGKGFRVMLDLKYHDIPNTVAGAVRAACGLGVWMLNLHASSARKTMTEVAAAVKDIPNRPKIIAVTLLTSMKQADLDELGIKGTPEEVVLRWAALAQSCGCDGVVNAPAETRKLRSELGADFILVTPNIRPGVVQNDDQNLERAMTPYDAIIAGSSYLVIGRPITKAPDPLAALRSINEDVQRAEIDLASNVV